MVVGHPLFPQKQLIDADATDGRYYLPGVVDWKLLTAVVQGSVFRDLYAKFLAFLAVILFGGNTGLPIFLPSLSLSVCAAVSGFYL